MVIYFNYGLRKFLMCNEAFVVDFICQERKRVYIWFQYVYNKMLLKNKLSSNHHRNLSKVSFVAKK